MSQPEITGLSTVCSDLFSSFARSDQRRWGEMYVHGLLTVPGRKSMKRISDQVAGGGAEQCLQQFVNQSTWEWQMVRRDLAHRLLRPLRPQALVFREVVFPKNGAHSAGVARQFAPSAGRLLNCQLGIAVFLASQEGSCPINWRLQLPPAWDADRSRRTRAHLPDHECHRPAWQHMVGAVDETLADWGLPRLPVIADMRHGEHVNALAEALESRGLSYVLRVSPSTPAMAVRPAQEAPKTLSFGDVISRSAQASPLASKRWHLSSQRAGTTQLIATRLPAPRGRRRRQTTARHVAAEWPPVRRAAGNTWLTTLDSSRLHHLPDYIALHDRIDADLDRMYDGSGLRHFEGRSFPGWHHHVTLCSVAHAWPYLHDGAPGPELAQAG